MKPTKHYLKKEREREDRNIREGMNLFKYTVHTYGIAIMQPPHIINVC
jgi:hypothetical protein